MVRRLGGSAGWQYPTNQQRGKPETQSIVRGEAELLMLNQRSAEIVRRIGSRRAGVEPVR